MLTPLRSPRASKRRVSQILNFPAPTGGWVSDANVNGDSVNTARILENLVPKQNVVYVRNGSITVGLITGRVETLADFDNGVIQHLLAANSTTVYRIPLAGTPGGAPPSGISLATGFANARWQHVMMANAADEAKLVMVNAQDGIWVYDGVTLTEGLASAANQTVNNVINYKGRLWFTKTGETTAYYGAVLSNDPATLTPFPIGAVLRNGGELIAINSLSMDGGSGPDDYLVMVTSRGEIVVYSGIDPADDMRLVGVFKTAVPTSKRCLTKSGSDLIYYGSNGPQLLSRLFAAAEGLDPLQIPIRTEFENAIVERSNIFGWDLINYPKRGWVLFNVPDFDPSKADQYVLNLESLSWFKIKGWNALCWASHSTNLYFGTANGRIVRADYGYSDDEDPINFDYMQTWHAYQSVGRKKFNIAQVTIQANSLPKIAIDMNVDYRDEAPNSEPGFSPEVDESPWDVSPWDLSPWSGSEVFYVNSIGLTNIGYVGALRYRGRLKNSTHVLHGYRIAFEEGEFL